MAVPAMSTRPKNSAFIIITNEAIHHIFKILILNQGCSQKCHNNENIHVDSNKSVNHQDILLNAK